VILLFGLHEFGVVLAEYGFERGWSALLHGMNILNELKNVCGHDEEVARWTGTRIPVRVRCSTWNKKAATGSNLDFLVVHLDDQRAFEDIPSFIVVVMHMRRSNQASLPGWASGVAPFSDYKVVGGAAECVSSKGRSDRR
jgi:hypothetical protein